jgi:hypothetical protein
MGGSTGDHVLVIDSPGFLVFVTSTLDEICRSCRVGQYSYHYVGSLLFHDSTDGPFGAVVRVRSDAQEVRQKRRELSRSQQTPRQESHGSAILMLELLKDFWGFMGKRKKYWLAPLILVMILLGALLVLAHGSTIAPFIYTIF